MIVNLHQVFILFGSALWMVGFFMTTENFYPYCLIGFFLGPVILTVGIIGWIIHYKKIKKAFPNPFRSFNRILSKKKGLLKYHIAGFQFMFSYLLHFWTCCILFWISITLFGTILLKSSSSFKTAQYYVENDTQLIDKIGQIQYYGFLVNGSIFSNESGDITFSIIGQKEIVSARVIISNDEVLTVNYVSKE